MTVSILDHALISARYFYPWPNHFDAPFSVEGDGFRLGCRYLKHADNLPTVVHFHGNGETVADYLGDFEQRMAGLGVNLLLAEYRGYGMSSGQPGLTAMLDDVRLIVEASGVSPERIIFFGRSLGSLYAMHGVHLYPQAAGLIIESGLADPLDRVLMRVEPWQLDTTMEVLQEEVDRHLNQREKIAGFSGSKLIMHTRNDDLVEVSHAERLYQWAGEPKQLLIFERGNHNNIMEVNRQAYFQAVGDFILENSCPRNTQK